MDLKSTNGSPVLADPAPLNKSRVGMFSSRMSRSQSGTGLTVPKKKPVKLDDVRSNGWLDAMKSSSPPRKKVVKEFNIVDSIPDDADVAYQSWMVCSLMY